MTKSITITYNEADESQIMALFKKFKIKIEAYAQQPSSPEPQPLGKNPLIKTKDDIKNDLSEAVAEMHADMRGETELPDFFESLKRIEKELTEEKNL